MSVSGKHSCVVEIRLASDRGSTRAGGLLGIHHFCFAGFQRLDRLEWGGLRALSLYRLGAGERREPTFLSGFEVLTLVTAGRLRRTGTFESWQDLGAGSVELISTGMGANLGVEAIGNDLAEFTEIWLASDRPLGEARRQWRPAMPERGETILAAAAPASGALRLAGDAEILRVSLGDRGRFARTLDTETCAYLAVIEGMIETGQLRAGPGDAFAISGPGKFRASGKGSFLFVATGPGSDRLQAATRLRSLIQ